MCRYTPEVRAEIGKYASQHGSGAASAFFTRKLKRKVRQSTVHSIKIAYLECVRQKRTADSSDDDVAELHPKKRGRPLLLGDCVEQQLQLYLKKIREHGGVVTASVVVAAARGILISTDRSKLIEFGGYIDLSRQWAYHFLRRMNFVRRKATTSKSKPTPIEFAAAKKAFLDDVSSVVTMEEIPPELILNWDQTGIHLVPASGWTMDLEGSKRVEVSGVNDKRQITAVFCGSLVGDFLPIQLIYKGKTQRCHPRYKFPSHWHITQSPKHWSTENTMLEYINEIIVPYVESWRDDFGESKSALVIMDNFKGQITSGVNTLLESHNIHVCLLPPNTTDLLQPMDISVNKPAKDFLKRKFEDWYSKEVTKQLQGVSDIESADIQPVNLSMAAVKELSALWLVEMAGYIAENPHFVVSGFRRAGISDALDDVSYEGHSDSEREEELSDSDFDSDDMVGSFSSESD